MRWPCPILLVVFGCGPTVTLESDGGDGSATGGTATDDSASDGAGATAGIPPPPPAACEPMPIGGLDPIPEPSSCEAYSSGTDERFPELTVRIVNATDVPIVVRKHFYDWTAQRHFQVTGTMGGREVSTETDSCPMFWGLPSCSSLGGVPADCEPGGVGVPSIRLEPGGWWQESWRTWLTTVATLPGACVADGTEPQECVAVVNAGPGTYELESDAMPAANCAENCEELPNGSLECRSECACEPDEHGACEVTELGPRPSSTLFARAAWDGVCEEVEITFAR